MTDPRGAEPEGEASARERAARVEAEEAVQARDDILAIVSHDLRNPLQAISMGAAALEQLAGPRGAAPAGVIRRAIADMDRLIQDLLDVNRITSGGGLRVETAPVRVGELCEDLHAALGPIAHAKRQELTCELGEASVLLRADRTRLAQVFSNLVGNASKFAPEGGTIAVRLRREGNEAVVEVADNGPGIAAEDLPRIFDRFWQARRVRRGGGVGLGLAITQGIIQAHGGRIWARSTPGAGTRFFFTLPIVEATSAG
jgi:signal transduction histidine kinase